MHRFWWTNFLTLPPRCDVDCLADFDPVAEGKAGTGQAMVIGVMEHIEEAGIHSGDSACSLPPYSLSKPIVAKLKEQTRALAKALKVRGLMNVQYAIKDGDIYLIEVNPRASRTVPLSARQRACRGRRLRRRLWPASRCRRWDCRSCRPLNTCQ